MEQEYRDAAEAQYEMVMSGEETDRCHRSFARLVSSVIDKSEERWKIVRLLKMWQAFRDVPQDADLSDGTEWNGRRRADWWVYDRQWCCRYIQNEIYRIHQEQGILPAVVLPGQCLRCCSYLAPEILRFAGHLLGTDRLEISYAVFAKSNLYGAIRYQMENDESGGELRYGAREDNFMEEQLEKLRFFHVCMSGETEDRMWDDQLLFLDDGREGELLALHEAGYFPEETLGEALEILRRNGRLRLVPTVLSWMNVDELMM